MANVFDVAEYILSKTDVIPALKLQKLVYYSQAWSLVWDDSELFNEPIQAWANGPVVPVLYGRHRLQYSVSPGELGGDAAALSEIQTDTVDAILQSYGDKSSQWLSDLTHAEVPWQQAREGIPDGVRSQAPIPTASLADYYSSL